jgi:hypothetical protein
MGVGRTILAAIFAFSVAMLPIAGSAGYSLKPTDMMAMSGSGDDMSVAQDVPDCCPPEGTPCDKVNCDRVSMVACASTCCSFLVPASSGIMFPVVLSETMPSFESRIFRSQSSSAPFRPPRA